MMCTHYCYHYRDLFDLKQLETGEHDYVGTRIKVVPIKTMIRGLCYKFNLSNPLPLQNKQLHLIIGSSILGLDKLKKVDLFIGAENTWQGTIGLYTNHPLIASGVFSVDAVNQAQYIF